MSVKQLNPTKVKLFTKSVINLTANEYAQCLLLNFNDEGTMKSELEYQRELGFADSQVILIKRTNNEIVAWSLLVYCGSSFLTHFFVADDYRRQGLGRKLVNKAIKHGNIQCCAFDNISTAFFKNFNDVIQCEFDNDGSYDVEDGRAA